MKNEDIKTLIFYAIRSVRDTTNQLVAEEVSGFINNNIDCFTPTDLKIIKRDLQHNKLYKNLFSI